MPSHQIPHSTGMRDAGYNIIIIQECITKTGHRDANGVPQPDPVKFPHGMKNLVDYIHSKGLKAGIYTDVGPRTCAGYEGSYGHEQIDALTYAQWGIDFIEEDACNKPAGHLYKDLYARMRDAIVDAHKQTGHPMMFYMCVWGSERVYEWGPSHGTLWRTTGDICPPGHASWNRMLGNFRGDTRFPNATAPGGWQDPDMLVVGMSGLTPLEWRTHFSLWAMAAAPLWAGIDVSNLPPGALQVFTNHEVIAVDQDPIGQMATMLPPPKSAITGASPAISTRTERGGVSVRPCAEDHTQWVYNDTSQTLSERGTNHCLTVIDCGMDAGVPLIMYDCVGAGNGACHPLHNGNQMFSLSPSAAAGKTFGALTNINSKLCVSDTSDHSVEQFPCAHSARWSLNADGQLLVEDSNELVSSEAYCLSTTSPPPPPSPSEVWVRPLKAPPGSKVAAAVLLFNPNAGNEANITVTFADLQSRVPGLDAALPLHARDLWLHKDLPAMQGGYTATGVPPHGAVMLKLTQ